MALVDGVSFTATQGTTADFAFGSKRPSFLTPAQAVTNATLTNGQTVSYLAQDSLTAPTQREWGHGTFTAATTTVSRATILGAVNAGTGGTTAISFNNAPIVSLTLLATDVPAASTPTTPGGATTQFQYNNAGAFAGTAGITYDATNQGITIGSSGGQLNGNNVGGFTNRIDVRNVADTNWASFAIGGFDLMSGGTRQGYFDNSGGPRISADSGNAVTIQGNAGTGIVEMRGQIAFDSSDTQRLQGEATGALAQRSGVTAQAYRVYNTWTDASNYERGGFDWIGTSNTFRIRSENAGTGTNRLIAIDGFNKAGAPVAGDLPSGSWGLIHDTNGGTFNLCYNNGGVLVKVALV